MSDLSINFTVLPTFSRTLAIDSRSTHRADGAEITMVCISLLRDGDTIYTAEQANPKVASSLVRTLATRIAADPNIFWDEAIARRWNGACWCDAMPELRAWGAALSTTLGIKYFDSTQKEGWLQTCYTAGVAEQGACGAEEGGFSAMGRCKGVPLSDGVLSYEDGEWVLTEHCPKNRNTSTLVVSSEEVRAHIQSPDSGLLHHYLTTSFEKDHLEFLPQWLGLHLIKHVLPASAGQKFLLLQGAGGEGKSVLVDLIAGLVGDENCAFIGLDELFDRTYHVLEGKAAMIAPENDPHKPWDIRGLNRITCGERLQARAVYQLPRTFAPVCLVTQVCNEPPRFNEQSRALERRMLVMHLTNFQDVSGKRIPELGKKIVQQEYAKLVGYALSGAHRIYENGAELDIPASVAASGRDLARSDVQVEALLPMLEFGDYAISLKELRAFYTRMCEEEGKKPLAMPKLLKEIIRVAEREKVGTIPKRLPRRTGYDTALANDNLFKKRATGPVSLIKDTRTNQPIVLEEREDLLYGVRIAADVLDDQEVGLKWASVDGRSKQNKQARQIDALEQEKALAKVVNISTKAGMTPGELAELIKVACG